jgi:hypothetical protein
VERYTFKLLSHLDDDKLMALSAIAAMLELYLGVRYTAGIFYSDMLLGFL